MRALPWPMTWASEREPRGRSFRPAGRARRDFTRDHTTTTSDHSHHGPRTSQGMWRVT